MPIDPAAPCIPTFEGPSATEPLTSCGDRTSVASPSGTRSRSKRPARGSAAGVSKPEGHSPRGPSTAGSPCPFVVLRGRRAVLGDVQAPRAARATPTPATIELVVPRAAARPSAWRRHRPRARAHTPPSPPARARAGNPRAARARSPAGLPARLSGASRSSNSSLAARRARGAHAFARLGVEVLRSSRSARGRRASSSPANRSARSPLFAPRRPPSAAGRARAAAARAPPSRRATAYRRAALRAPPRAPLAPARAADARAEGVAARRFGGMMGCVPRRAASALRRLAGARALDHLFFDRRRPRPRGAARRAALATLRSPRRADVASAVVRRARRRPRPCRPPGRGRVRSLPRRRARPRCTHEAQLGRARRRANAPAAPPAP